MNWLLHVTGIDTQQSQPYDFWSGIANPLERILEVLVLLALAYYHHNCHVHRCLRWARHQVGSYRVCKRHHPDMPARIQPEHIQFAFNQSKEVNK